jgi:hypothetical protein
MVGIRAKTLLPRSPGAVARSRRPRARARAVRLGTEVAAVAFSIAALGATAADALCRRTLSQLLLSLVTSQANRSRPGAICSGRMPGGTLHATRSVRPWSRTNRVRSATQCEVAEHSGPRDTGLFGDAGDAAMPGCFGRRIGSPQHNKSWATGNAPAPLAARRARNSPQIMAAEAGHRPKDRGGTGVEKLLLRTQRRSWPDVGDTRPGLCRSGLNGLRCFDWRKRSAARDAQPSPIPDLFGVVAR